MADCFISYSTKDQRLADWIAMELQRHGLTVFMASATLTPGANWSTSIRKNLQTSEWVVFLASRAACESPWVQQELGMAIGASKRLIPILWDIEPSQLPGWVRERQALDLRHASLEELRASMAGIAETFKQQRARGLMILGTLAFAFIAFGAADRNA
jgi:hypothetical protein